jgi:hypothetical protein
MFTIGRLCTPQGQPCFPTTRVHCLCPAVVPCAGIPLHEESAASHWPESAAGAGAGAQGLHTVSSTTYIPLQGATYLASIGPMRHHCHVGMGCPHALASFGAMRTHCTLKYPDALLTASTHHQLRVKSNHTVLACMLRIAAVC